MEKILEILGWDLNHLAGGFFGGVIVLIIIKSLTVRAVISSLVGGALCAVYVTPAIIGIWPTTASFQDGVAFFVGLVGMLLIGGIIVVATMFKNDPIGTIKTVRSVIPSISFNKDK